MTSTPRRRISGTPSSCSIGERAKRTTSSTGAIACGRGLDAVEHDGGVEVPPHRVGAEDRSAVVPAGDHVVCAGGEGLDRYALAATVGANVTTWPTISGA